MYPMTYDGPLDFLSNRHLMAQFEQGDWITIKEGETYPCDQFVIPYHYQDDLSSVLIPHGFIQDRVEKLANDIAKTVTKPMVACCVLKGAYGFFANLTDHLKKMKGNQGHTSNCC